MNITFSMHVFFVGNIFWEHVVTKALFTGDVDGPCRAITVCCVCVCVFPDSNL